jgi:5'-nucleotidase
MTASGPPLALVTNDDGIRSEGLRVLAGAARDAGCDVVVAAPLRDSSGTSASLTAVEADGRIVVEEVELEGLDGVAAFGVAATPGFIVVVAARGAFGRVPDVVVSGINRGANTGHAVLHSGTVGAAMTARVHGARALAVSLAGEGRGCHWETAAVHARDVLGWMPTIADPVVLNLNVPNVPEADVRGLREARLAPFGTVQTVIAESGRGWVKLGVAEPEVTPDPGTDAALLAAGFASLTPLRPLCSAHEVALPVARAEGAHAARR